MMRPDPNATTSAFVGKLGALVTSLVIVFGGLIKIIEHHSTPTPDLTATVSFSDFYWPPTLDNEYRKLHSLADPNRISNTLRSDHVSINPTTLTDVVQSISSYLLNSTPDKLPLSLSTIRGMWFVTGRNNGTKGCHAVQLTLPNTSLVSVLKEDEEPRIIENSATIHLGDLQPKERIQMLAWTAYIAPSKYEAQSIRLTHAYGVGKVTVISTTTPFWTWMGDNYPVVLFGTILVAILLLFFLCPLRPHPRTPTGRTPHPNYKRSHSRLHPPPLP